MGRVLAVQMVIGIGFVALFVFSGLVCPVLLFVFVWCPEPGEGIRPGKEAIRGWCLSRFDLSQPGL